MAWAAYPLDDFLETRPFFILRDPPRHADVLDVRHEHQVAPGERDVGRHPGALGADGALRDLHHQLLTLLQQLLDGSSRLATGPGHLQAFLINLALDDRIAWLRVRGEVGGILVFDLQGTFLREFPVNQIEPSTAEPWGVFVYDDFVFVSDVEDFTVKIFDKDGNMIKKFGEYGDRYGKFKYPIYAVTDGKKIYVSDAYNYRIQVFSITP